MNSTVRIVALAAAALTATWAVAQYPAWWSQRGLLTTAAADDYAVANLGQLKHIARAARDEFNQKLPGGAGTEINTLVDSWLAPAPAGVTRDDYAALTVGQLKAVAKPFYTRLIAAGVVTGYPWSATTSDDDSYALANLGQVKSLYAFPILTAANDADQDGLLDTWELSRGLSNSVNNAASDTDGDGLLDVEEYLLGCAPMVAASTGGSIQLVLLTP